MAWAWFKALHLVFMVTWFAGLFYLPRLYVYHAMAEDAVGIDRFKVMERKLFYGIMTPSALLVVVFGVATILSAPAGLYTGAYWLHAKLVIVAALLFYHYLCFVHLKNLKHDRNSRSHVYFRWFNEAPVLGLFVVVILAVIRPF